jgi:hypothetical protein
VNRTEVRDRELQVPEGGLLGGGLRYYSDKWSADFGMMVPAKHSNFPDRRRTCQPKGFEALPDYDRHQPRVDLQFRIRATCRA